MAKSKKAKLQISRNASILYLHNYEGWAIHNVGKLWLDEIAGVSVDYKNSNDFKVQDFDDYNLIWFGYLDIFLNHNSRSYFTTEMLRRSIVSIHDPLEIFPQQRDWKSVDINLKQWWRISSLNRWMRLKSLNSLTHLVTTSTEMQSKLSAYNIMATIIPTASSLILRSKNRLTTTGSKVLSVFEIYPRKNAPLLLDIQAACKQSLGITFDTKIGKKILPAHDYINLLDDHEIYVCTSYQEGGPLPAMDAMQRGAVVISTPVGQIQDMIKDGQNGFICNTKEDFVSKISFLSNNLNVLHTMRLKSLDMINKSRNKEYVKRKSSAFIDSILETNVSSIIKPSKRINSYTSWLFKSVAYRLIFRINIMIIYCNENRHKSNTGQT